MLFIFTLNWNGSDKLVKLHKSLMPNLKGIDYAWFIKDNGSIDNSAEIVSNWKENIIFKKYPNNLQNFSQGMNYLFNESHPGDEDDILLLNNDVTFNDDASLERMLNILHTDNSVGAVGARLLYTGTNKLQHAGVVFKPEYKLPVHFRANEVSDGQAEKNRTFQVVTGAVLLTKAKYYKNSFTNKSGNQGMDENYHWAFDDVDLCLSIKINQKKKIVYCGKTNISHEESATLKKNPANRLFMNHNINYLKTKWNNKYIMDENSYTKNVKYGLY